MRHWLETMSGRRYDLLSDDPDFELEDLIWGCARECRHSNQLRPDVEHYSVAEHSVCVGDLTLEIYGDSRIVDNGANTYVRAYPFADQPPDIQRLIRTAYAHDLIEGLLRDVATPMKVLMGPDAYQAIEDRGQRAIARRYDTIYPMPPEVKEIDARIVLDENTQLRIPRDRSDWGLPADLEPLGVRFHCWGPRRAADAFRAALAAVGIR